MIAMHYPRGKTPKHLLIAVVLGLGMGAVSTGLAHARSASPLPRCENDKCLFFYQCSDGYENYNCEWDFGSLVCRSELCNALPPT
jgi:hypothetical protein